MEDLNSCIREKANPIQIKECSIEFRKEGQTIFYSVKEEHLYLLHPFFSIINQTTSNVN
jgi:hypothetical protein